MHGNVFIAMQQGMVDFGRYPNDAVSEVTAKHTISAFDRDIAISKIRDRLLQLDGEPLVILLRDLRDAAMRHGADDVVELTGIE